MLRRPQSQQPIAAGSDLEPEFLVVLEPVLEFLLTVGKDRHGRLTLSNAARRDRRFPRYGATILRRQARNVRD